MVITDLDIRREEEDLEVRFPAALVARLRRENGGSVQKYERWWTLFPVWDTSDKRMMKKTFNSIARETRAAWEFDHLPSDAIAIGRGDDGTVLALLALATGEVKPALYEWNIREPHMKPIADHLLELWETDDR